MSKMELAIFTPAIAEELIAKGFDLESKTERAFLFKDSAQLRAALEEIMEKLDLY